jgi:hypothetical protein
MGHEKIFLVPIYNDNMRSLDSCGQYSYHVRGPEMKI